MSEDEKQETEKKFFFTTDVNKLVVSDKVPCNNEKDWLYFRQSG